MAGWNVVRYMQRLRTFNVEAETTKIINKSRDQIEDVNREALDFGKDFHGKTVGTYSGNTELIAKASTRNPPNRSKNAGSPYNFNWTGAFMDGIFITYESHTINFFSKGLGDTKKTAWILNRDLLGVSDKDADFINYEIIMPRLQWAFKNKMNK